ncbi:MAG: hypothetical protein K2M34_00250 [Alphaproteobacteria bacterium]|nr:hypothetical protein [Alphaproteobacteria bacterium]
MIEITSLVDDVHGQLGVWCAATADSTELARLADMTVASGVGMISVAPSAVRTVWPWLEGHSVKIFPRFYFGTAHAPTDSDMSQLAVDINTSFKSGASGAIVFVAQRYLKALVNALHIVRDDLFFNKELIIGLDVGDIEASEWADVFDCMCRIRANGLMLALTRDRGDKSDFVGRVYAALDAWNPGFLGDVYWMTGGNLLRGEQVMRLTADMQPELSARTHLMICE